MRHALIVILFALAGCGGVPADPTNGSDPPVPSNAVEPAPSQTAAIPAAFHGTFAASPAACTGQDESRLIVADRALRFYESEARVTSVAIEGPRTVRVAADYRGEGESWNETRTLSLSPDGSRLTVTARGSQSERLRCPAQSGATAPPAAEWDHASSGAGDALYLSEAGTRRLTLFCPARADEIQVNVPAFTAVASEERMSLGSGGTVVALVADWRGDRERGGVTGKGPVPDELADILSGPIGVNYGAQNSGPHPLVPRDMAAGFLVACRD